MKKIILLLLVTVSGYSQTLLKLKAIEYAPGSGYCIITNSLGVQTYTPCNAVTGLLPSTTSITINGSTQSFTSTPSFSVGNISGSLTANYIPKSVSSSSLTNSAFYEASSGFVGLNTSTPTNPLHIISTSTVNTDANSRAALFETNLIASLAQFKSASGNLVSFGTSAGGGTPCKFCFVDDNTGNHELMLRTGLALYNSGGQPYYYLDLNSLNAHVSFGPRLTQPMQMFNETTGKFIFSIDADGTTNLNQEVGSTVANGGISFPAETANTLSYFNASHNIKSADTATYPSLTELSYVKGLSSLLQTQLNSKTKIVGFNTADALTPANTSNNVIKSITVAANTYANGNTLRLFGGGDKTGTAGTCTVRIYANTVNNLTGSPVLIAQSVFSNTALTFQMDRNLFVRSTTTWGYASNINNGMGPLGSSTINSNDLAIDWTVTQYIIIAVQLASGADQVNVKVFSVIEF